MASDSDTEPESGYHSRSRSQSRRARRRKQTNQQKRQQQQQQSMPAVPEDPDELAKAQGYPSAFQQQMAHKTNNSSAYNNASKDRQEDADAMGMQPFEWIGPDSTSMDGPVTYAKAMRGEIPMRPGDPNQSLKTGEQGGGTDPMDQDGLKLRLELNIDIEVELKARIQGDITLSLLE